MFSLSSEQFSMVSITSFGKVFHVLSNARHCHTFSDNIAVGFLKYILSCLCSDGIMSGCVPTFLTKDDPPLFDDVPLTEKSGKVSFLLLRTKIGMH